MAIVAAAVFAARRAPVRREGSAAASAAQIGFLARRVEDALAVLADARLFVRSASEHLDSLHRAMEHCEHEDAD